MISALQNDLKNNKNFAIFVKFSMNYVIKNVEKGQQKEFVVQ